MDPIVTDDQTVTELKNFLSDVIEEDFSGEFTFHDFRVVVGTTHTNLIFDILLPFESKENCYCVITVDRG